MKIGTARHLQPLRLMNSRTPEYRHLSFRQTRLTFHCVQNAVRSVKLRRVSIYIYRFDISVAYIMIEPPGGG